MSSSRAARGFFFKIAIGGANSWAMKFRWLLIVGLLVLGARPTFAQRWSASPFVGYRFGGSIENAVTGNSMSIKDHMSYGVELDIGRVRSGLSLALLYSHQSTSTDLRSVVPASKVEIDSDEMMVGVVQELYDDKFRPFVAAYAGATYVQPSGYDQELRFGFGLGVGMNYYITKHVGVRMDVRGFGTIVDKGDGFLCANGGCAAQWSETVFWQGEAAASVFVTF